MRSVGIVTCRALPDGDEDADLLREAMRVRSLRAEWCSWDDPEVDWDEFALTVVRSTWDYTADRDRFLRWAASVARLHNRAEVLGWNSDKTYLRELGAAGIPVVATRWIDPGEPLPPATGEFVVKPTVGAGSKGAGRFDPRQAGAGAAAQRHADALHAAGRTVMVQPYLDGIDAEGETALVYVGGQFAHAVTKSAMLNPSTANALDPAFADSLWMDEEIKPATPSPADVELGQQVAGFVRARFGVLLYMRIDLVPTAAGPVVLEVELVEPSLFLLHDPTTADRLAAAIAELADRSDRADRAMPRPGPA